MGNILAVGCALLISCGAQSITEQTIVFQTAVYEVPLEMDSLNSGIRCNRYPLLAAQRSSVFARFAD